MLKKTNSNPLVGVPYGIFGVWALIAALVPASDGTKLEMVGFGAVFCLLLIALYIVPVLCRDNRLQWEEGNRVIGSIRANFLSITEIDQKLTQLADEFMALCQEQVKFQNAESAVAEAKAIEEKIVRAKSAFWSAHALARELGYVLKEHVSDYASAPKAPARRRSSAGRLAAP